MESLHGAWLDDITAGQRDHMAFNEGMVWVTQCLQKNEADSEEKF